MKNIILISIALFVVSCGNDVRKYDAYGNFEADEVLISSEANGKIMELNIEEGMKIKEGTFIGYIDTLQLHLQKKQLEAKINAIKSQYGNIIANVNVLNEKEKVLLNDKERFENMLEKKAATQKQVDDINGQIAILNKQKQEINSRNNNIITEIRTIEANIEQIEDQIKRCRIICPVGGTVLNKYAEQYEITAAGKPLFKIAKLDAITLRAYASGSQLPHIKLGQKVDVFIDETESSDQKFTGTICYISSEAEFTPKIIQTKEDRVNMVYAVKIKIKNEGSMKIGMPGAVNFE